jgi:hypothetical protein
MKVWSWIAIVLAVLASAFSLFFVHMMPLGICDAIFDPIRTELQTAHSRDDAGRFAGRVCGWVGHGVDAIKWLSVIPLILTNPALCVVLWLHRRKKRPAAGPWQD